MDYMSKYDEWTSNPYFDMETRKELSNILEDKKEIQDRFYKNLEFGTGGLRGVIGAGTNRINKYTVRRATYGLAKYILQEAGESAKDKGVVIAYDSRHKSDEFCLEAAKTLAACGIKTYIFDELRPTPELSFAVRHLGCIAGIVITASHYPPEYNGYKVYWTDGGQVCPEIAEDIIKQVNTIEYYSTIPTMEEKEARDNNLIIELNEEIDNTFIDAVKSQSIRPDIIKAQGNNIKVVFTPLHGTGNKSIQRVLKEVGFENVIVVKEQEMPDPNFTTVKSPNPEDKAAFDIAIEIAKEKDADIIIGTDPDCDRVGVVIKNNDQEYVTLNGNQVGSLLVDYVLSNIKNDIKQMNNPVIIKTIVTSELGAKIAESYGVGCINTLTGFKFIGEKIHEFELNKNKTFIMGYEESYGYLVGTHARDKDGVVSALLIAEMAAFYKSKDMSLYEGLIDVYEKYGYYKEELKSITLKGIDGMEKIKSIMSYFRDNEIETLGNSKVVDIKDYSKEIDGLPKSDVLKLLLEDGGWVAIRPSGTEPKIKFYFGVNGNESELVNKKLDEIICSIDSIINNM